MPPQAVQRSETENPHTLRVPNVIDGAVVEFGMDGAVVETSTISTIGTAIVEEACIVTMPSTDAFSIEVLPEKSSSEEGPKSWDAEQTDPGMKPSAGMIQEFS